MRGEKTPNFEKRSAAVLLNHYILAAVRAISTKFGTLIDFDILDLFDRYKFEILKIQHGGVRHLENSKNRDISAAARAISTKLATVTQFDPLDRSER